MTNWFAAIGGAYSGIDAARYGLSVVSQNIQNADTEGYTRQRADQVSVDATLTASLYSNRSGNLYGGVRVADVTRLNDPVLDARMREEHARGATSGTAAQAMSDIEDVFPEPGKDGLSARLDDFWTSWSSLASNPGDTAARTGVIKSASAVATTLNGLSRSLSNVADATGAALSDDVAQVNTAAGQLADLNGKIAIGSATGQNVNSLLDQRDSLLDKIGKLVGGTAAIEANGAATVTVGGQTLVSAGTATEMTADGATVSVGGAPVTLTGGSAAARVTTLTTTIPGYQSQLDAVADAVATAANGAQGNGYDAAGAPGGALFGGSGAAGISVVLTDPAGIAASSRPGGNLDGGNAVAASQLGKNADGPDRKYAALIGDIGASSARAQQLASTQDAVVSNVDSLHQATSGVSYDEEISQMLTYQHAFNASSRVLTTIDQMLDTLINHTGVVGLS